VVAERLAHVSGVHLEQGYVVGAGAGDQHVVDRVGQPVEELLERCRVGGVEGGGAPRVDVARRSLEPLAIPAGKDDLGALTAGAAGSFEPDSGAAADEDDGLAEQFRLAGIGTSGGFGGHGFSHGWCRRPITRSPPAVLRTPAGSSSAASDSELVRA
jgi:hypothetical protein